MSAVGRSRSLPGIALFLLLVGLQLTLLAGPRHVLLSLGLIAGLATIAYLVTGYALERALLLAILVACLEPTEIGRRLLSLAVLFPLLAGFLWLLDRLTARATPALGRNSKLETRNSALHIPLGPAETLALLLVAVAALEAISGWAHGYDPNDVRYEFNQYAYYLLVIIAARTEFTQRGIRNVIVAIIGATALVAVQYIHIYIAYGGAQRPASDQQHLLNLAIPLLVAFIPGQEKPLLKAACVSLLILMALAVYVSLTRAMWLYIPLSVLLVLVLLYRRRLFRPAAGITTVVLLLALALGGLKVSGILTSGRNASRPLPMVGRARSLQNLTQDPSLILRYDLALQVLDRWRHHPLLGCGLGDFVRYRLLSDRIHRNLLDSTYITVLWKLGLVGLVIFCALYAVFLQRLYFVYRHAQNQFQIACAAGTFAAFIALIITGVESGVLCAYRFNLVWAILMGIFERWAREIKYAKSRI